MNIPDEAVDAAWTVYLASTRDGLEMINAMLEAAAPFMYAACGRADYGQRPAREPQEGVGP